MHHSACPRTAAKHDEYEAQRKAQDAAGEAGEGWRGGGGLGAGRRRGARRARWPAAQQSDPLGRTAPPPINRPPACRLPVERSKGAGLGLAELGAEGAAHQRTGGEAQANVCGSGGAQGGGARGWTKGHEEALGGCPTWVQELGSSRVATPCYCCNETTAPLAAANSAEPPRLPHARQHPEAPTAPRRPACTHTGRRRRP